MQWRGEEVSVLPSIPSKGSQPPLARLSDTLCEGEGQKSQRKGSVVGWVQLGWLPSTAPITHPCWVLIPCSS